MSELSNRDARAVPENSDVDERQPVTGSRLNSAPIRNNFRIIKDEIEELQRRRYPMLIRTISDTYNNPLPSLLLGEPLQYGNDQLWIGSPSSTAPNTESVNYRLMWYGSDQTWVGRNNSVASGTATIFGSSNTIASYFGGGNSYGNLLLGASNTINMNSNLGDTSYNVFIGRNNRATGATRVSNTTVVGYNNDLSGSSTNHGVNDTVVVGANNNLWTSASNSNYNVILGVNNSLSPTYHNACQTMTRNIVIGSNIYVQSGCSTPVYNNTVIGDSVYMNVYQGRYWDNVLIGNTSAGTITSMQRCVGVGRQLNGPLDPDSMGGVGNVADAVAIGYGATFYHRAAHIGGNEVQSISYGTGTGTMFVPRCDPRLKEGIEDADIDRCLADIERLPIKRYSYKDFVKAPRDRTVTGFLSSDFKKVFPKQVIIDRYQAGDEVIEDCESVDPSQLIPTLVAAVQALSAEVKRMHNEAPPATARRRA